MLRETDRTTSLFFAPNPILRALRDGIVLSTLRMPWVQRCMFGRLSQLHVHYRRSSPSVDRGTRWRWRRIRAGDRAPDVAFERYPGGRTALFELMRTLRPIVLLSGAESENLVARVRTLDLEACQVCDRVTHATRSPSTTLIDVNGDFASLYRLGQTFVCLIRPDGHVGLILNPSTAPGLEEYLSRICDPAEVRTAFA